MNQKVQRHVSPPFLPTHMCNLISLQLSHTQNKIKDIKSVQLYHFYLDCVFFWGGNGDRTQFDQIFQKALTLNLSQNHTISEVLGFIFAECLYILFLIWNILFYSIHVISVPLSSKNMVMTSVTYKCFSHRQAPTQRDFPCQHPY